MHRLLGQIDYEGRFLGAVASNHLATPIREWFREHPEEADTENHFFARFDRRPDGHFRCYLDLVGAHHWHAVESGTTLPLALKHSLESLIPDVPLSEFEAREN